MKLSIALRTTNDTVDIVDNLKGLQKVEYY